MGNRPTAHYDYTRAGVAMVTLKCRSGVWLCTITQEKFELTDIGQIVKDELVGIPNYYPQIKIGMYQVMPDHLHALVHVVRDLPAGVTLREVFRGFKLGVNRKCREHVGWKTYRAFEEGLNDTLIFNRDHLEREVAYVRDNVRRYRAKKANAQLFQEARLLKSAKIPAGLKLWRFGNGFLLDRPLIVKVQLSRSIGEEAKARVMARAADLLKQGAVFVSPFLSPAEQEVARLAIERGGAVIRIVPDYMGPRYKPMGRYFDLCVAGRLLEISAADESRPYAKLDRAMCLRMNEIAGMLAVPEGAVLAGTECPQGEGKGTECPQGEGKGTKCPQGECERVGKEAVTPFYPLDCGH